MKGIGSFEELTSEVGSLIMCVDAQTHIFTWFNMTTIRETIP